MAMGAIGPRWAIRRAAVEPEARLRVDSAPGLRPDVDTTIYSGRLIVPSPGNVVATASTVEMPMWPTPSPFGSSPAAALFRSKHLQA